MAKLYMAWERLDGRSGHEVGLLLLARLYEAYVGGPLPAIVLGPRGKPYWEASPWHFSISHSKGHAFCVLSDCPVGIDAEELDRNIRPHLAPRLLSPEEMAQYTASAEPQKTLLTFWVLKEAAAKRSGEGIRIHPNHTHFRLPDSRVQEIDGCLVAVVF